MLKKLFGSKKQPEKDSREAKLSPGISSSIMNAIGRKGIPTMPGAAQKAFKLAIDPDAEVRDFVEVIESDEALSARILKIANSVFFDRGKQSKTIEESVTVIGINELRSLLNATTLSELFPSRHPTRSLVWAHDIATALTARILAGRLLPGKEENAFLGGLMHDIGKLLLIQRAGTEYDQIVELVRTRAIPFCSAEEEVFVFNHTEVGQLIAENWNFTEDLIDIIRNHHQPWPEEKDPGLSPTLTDIVKAANTIAHSQGLGHGRGLGGFQNRCLEDLALIWEHLRIPSDDQRPLLDNIKRTFDLEFDLYKGNS